MRFAVIGGGIAGLTAAHLLSQRFEVTLFEASTQLGGHTHTVDVEADERSHAIDMGFIVFNEENYPGFARLLSRLGVSSQPSDMSFGVSSERSGLEYRASTLDTLFAQRRNVFRPSFQRLLVDILRFRRQARQLVSNGNGTDPSLDAYLRDGGYSQSFIDHFIVPMGAAIWSSDPTRMGSFPARTLIQFFENHRFLDTRHQPQWRTVRGGSRSYVAPLVKPYEDRIRLSSAVHGVRRLETHVEIAADSGTERFDHVVIACHSDQALKMLWDPTREEVEVLGSIPYQRNDTALHTDTRLMPRSKRAWASWNVRVPRQPSPGVAVTYHSNKLQNLNAPRDYLVTLNRTAEIHDDSILERVDFHHPIYSFRALRAQKRRAEVDGVKRTSYCGAYWGYGFHEDGVQSALSAVRPFGVEL